MKMKKILNICLAAAVVCAAEGVSARTVSLSAPAEAPQPAAREAAAPMPADNTRMAKPGKKTKAQTPAAYAATNRPAEAERLFRSEAVEQEIARIKGVLTNAKLAWMFENCFPNTLDTTVRKVVFDNLPFLLSDTVGFIRKLPTELIESFKSTLDEVREADLLVHVVDISHPQFEDQIAVVKQTLQEIGAGDKPVYLVFNKVDAYTYIKKEADDLTPAARENLSLDDLKKSWIARANTPCIFLSAKERIQIDKFRSDLYGMVREIHAGRYPFNNFLY